MIPSGWDSWGKIAIVQESFDCHEFETLWSTSLDKEREKIESSVFPAKRNVHDADGLVDDQDESDTIEQVWNNVMPDVNESHLVRLVYSLIPWEWLSWLTV